MMLFKRLFGGRSKKTVSVESDLKKYPKPDSPRGIEILRALLEGQNVDAINDLYEQSLEQWKTDWQCALCELLCKLNPEDNQKLILWLSAYISDNRKEHARKLHSFIQHLALEEDEKALWQDVNVHYALMNEDVKTAKNLIATIQKQDPDYSVVWPKIALVQFYSKRSEIRQAAEIAHNTLLDANTPAVAYPILLEALITAERLNFVADFCLRYAREETALNAEVINIGARAMLYSGRANLSLRFLQDHADLIAQAPYTWFTIRECVLKLDRYEDVRPLLEKVLSEGDTDELRFQRALLQIDLNDLEGATHTLSTFKDAQSEWAMQLAILIASQRPMMAQADEAYSAFLDQPYQRTNAAMIYAGNLLGQARTLNDLQKAEKILEAVSETSEHNADFLDLQVKILVALEMWEDAKKIHDRTPQVLTQSSSDRFEQYFLSREGKHKEARQISHVGTAKARNRAVHNGSSLPVAKTFSYDQVRDQVLCFCCVYNGIEFAQWFLDYYRNLGVDHFFFVDNASTDGTFEFLAEQKDVSLFLAEGSFKDSAHGVYWINDLIKSYAFGKWLFFVDMDEAFVFPMMDQGRSLDDLLKYFDANEFECAPSLMVDMFSDKGDGGSFEENCYFDNTYFSFPAERAPYKTTQGGFRTRMTGRNLLITKSPLVKVHAAFSYLENNHFHTHLKPSDVTTAVLHYKFVGALSDRIDEAINRKEHFLGATFYKDLKRAITAPDDETDDTFSQGPKTVTYNSSSDLLNIGVIETSDAWIAFDTNRVSEYKNSK